MALEAGVETPTLNLTDLGNPSNPYRLETSDNPGTFLVTEHLTTENYSTSSRSIQRALRAKNKLGFLNGTIDKPLSTSALLLSLWERCNDMLVSWLQNAISLPLRPLVAFVDDVRALWLELHDRFSPQNGPCIYELKKTLANLSQETNTVFSYIQQQEQHHLITSVAPPIETIALAARRPSQFSPKRDKPYCSHCKITGHTLAQCFKSGNATAPVCTHCEMTGHIAERCYKLHNYPPGHNYHKPRLNVVSMEAPSSATNNDPNLVLTKEQYQEIITLLHKTNSTASPSANQLQIVPPTQPHISLAIGISLCLSSFSSTSQPWIINTGPTDHMICSPSLFTKITSTTSNFVRLPNGEVAIVTYISVVQVIATLLLHDVLCVPNFHFNLLSATKLAKQLNYCFMFLSDACFI
ncbi:uncharacterized protein LOC116127438 [Pistacia vera]|uniref:uncharacterized protein LOC116127438 n=1 Tax=Pistacia vera TaxID=55513 RepID=UPI001262B53C|nr:uncharacterized protein LOC116127438 [Pistacia vera]